MKKVSALIAALFLFVLAGCSAVEHGPVVPGTLTVDDAEVTEFAEIATAALEQPEMRAMRGDFLAASGDEALAPVVDRAVEVVLPEDTATYNTLAVHIYAMHIAGWLYDAKTDTAYDSVIVVYDCDTGETYVSTDEAFGADAPVASGNTKEHYIYSAVSSGYMLCGLDDDWVFYCENESHAALDAQQLQALNEQFRPEGWEYRAETPILPESDGLPTEESSETAPGEEAAESPEDAEESAGADVTAEESVLSDEELCRMAADAVNAGLAEGKFADGELIDTTVTAAKEYRITIDGEEPYEMHLLYVWLNGNRENGNDYAGQLLIDLTSGETMYLSGYDEGKIGFEAHDELMYYYYWQGLTAYEESGYLMNETETLVSLPEELLRNIQSGINA